MRLDSAPDYLDGAGDSYHVSGRAWRNGHGRPDRRVAGRGAEVFAPCAAAALYRRARVRGDWRLRRAVLLLLRGRRSWLPPAAARPSLPLRPFRRRAARQLGAERISQRFRRLSRRAERVWTFVKNMPGPLLWLYLPQHLALNLAALMYYPWRGQGAGRRQGQARRDPRAWSAVLRSRRLVQRARRVDAWTLRRR